MTERVRVKCIARLRNASDGTPAELKLDLAPRGYGGVDIRVADSRVPTRLRFRRSWREAAELTKLLQAQPAAQESTLTD
jgi:hypothetical protein